MKKIIKALIPKKMLELYWEIRSPKQPFSGWEGDYGSWQEASAKSVGYNADVILKKVDEGLSQVLNGTAAFERDSVAFKELIYSEDLLQSFQSIASKNHNSLSLLDFGGSLGSIYYQYKTLFEDVSVKWSVVEQDDFVKLGQQKYSNEELKFYHTIEEAQAQRQHDVLLLSSVLAYLDKPEEFLTSVLKYRFNYIIFYRTAFVDREKHLLTVQHVPESVYTASYPAWFFNEKKLTGILNKDYNLEKAFPGDIETNLMVGPNKCYWKCHVFKLKQ